MHFAQFQPLCHLSAKNYQNWWKFDKVLTKTNLHSFLRHGVEKVTLNGALRLKAAGRDVTVKLKSCLALKLSVCDGLRMVHNIEGG